MYRRVPLFLFLCPFKGKNQKHQHEQLMLLLMLMLLLYFTQIDFHLLVLPDCLLCTCWKRVSNAQLMTCFFSIE